MITITAFKWVPPFAQGLVRDLRVRWALEEAGLGYHARLIDFEDQKTAADRARQPFGQVPVFEEDGLVLFESGAIVLHIGTLGLWEPCAASLGTRRGSGSSKATQRRELDRWPETSGSGA